jgi:FKBP-type peptidyl-prolyl cis-trans isomerase
MIKWIQKIYNESFGKNTVEGLQALTSGVKSLNKAKEEIKSKREQKEEVKNQAVDQTATGVKILSSGVKLDKTIVDKAFNDLLKNKREKSLFCF